MEFHPVASIFPLLAGEELELLAADIRGNGLRNPVWVYEGKLLDGRNRVAACELVGVPVQTREFTGTEEEAIHFVWSENRARRQLNPGQAAGCVAKRDRFVQEAREKVEKQRDAAKQRQIAGKGADGSGGRGNKKSLPQFVGEGLGKHDNETVAVRAKAGCTNRRYLEVAEMLLNTAPERLEEVMSGQKTMS